MNLIEKYNYEPLYRVEKDGVRHYAGGDIENPLPSVTTILSATADKEFLEKWRQRVGEVEAEKITKQSSGIGDTLHDNLENFILRGETPKGPPLAQLLTKMVIRDGLSQVDEVWGVETGLYCKGLYAGTTDLCGVHNGIPAIMDFKNSRKKKKEEWIEDYKAQLAAYALAHNEMFGTNINKGVVMMATWDMVYMQFVFEGKEFQKCVDIWLRRLDEYYTLTG